MKIFITSAIISLIVWHCNAQQKIIPGEIKGSTDTFIVSKVQQFDSAKHIGIYSKSNKYNKGIPYSRAEKSGAFLPMNPKTDIHVDNNAIKQIIFDVLNKKLEALHDNKEHINLILKFEPTGKMTDIIFDIKDGSLINIQEIEKIDHQLRAKVKATFTGKQYLQYVAINYYPPNISF